MSNDESSIEFEVQGEGETSFVISGSTTEIDYSIQSQPDVNFIIIQNPPEVIFEVLNPQYSDFVIQQEPNQVEFFVENNYQTNFIISQIGQQGAAGQQGPEGPSGRGTTLPVTTGTAFTNGLEVILANCMSAQNFPLPPGAATLGERHTLKDSGGNAGLYNLTLTASGATIEGQPTFVLTYNRQAITVIGDGMNWNAIA